ncbi:MAG: alpha/beta hydrolase domain-containing protein [Blastomonas sp.]
MLDRRQFGQSAAMIAAMSAMGKYGEAFASPSPATNISGPINKGQRGHIFGGHTEDLAAHGYIEEEYLVSGTAQSFRPVGTLSSDGRWTLSPHDTAPFATRVIVQRPANAADFNGTVICEWANVSAGFEISSAVNQGFYKDGYAYAAISAQRMGLEGEERLKLGLKQWDQERYGELSIEGDSWSYDIFSQVARALGPKRPAGSLDPMGGLPVKRLFAMGESQSAARLLSYVNGVHQLANVFDAFMIVVAVGRSTEFDDFIYDPDKTLDENNNVRRSRTVQTRIRDDQPAPVIVINSETETPYYLPSRQPDSTWFRFYEVVGATHASAIGGGRRPDISDRDGVPHMAAKWDRMVDLFPVLEAVAVGIDKWLSGGPPLASFAPIEVAGTPPKITEDGFGNASGGIRMPEIIAPAARYVTQTNNASGRLEPFDDATLKAVYRDDADYAERIRAAAQWAEAVGLILPRHRDHYIARSANGPVPWY